LGRQKVAAAVHVAGRAAPAPTAWREDDRRSDHRAMRTVAALGASSTRRRASLAGGQNSPTPNPTLLHLPAKLATHARRRTLTISDTWPWAEAFLLCWQRLALPALTT
jgi:hypothetical protein